MINETDIRQVISNRILESSIVLPSETRARVAYAAGIAAGLDLYQALVLLKTLLVLVGGKVDDLERT